ncbi:hypothetical protein WMF30_53265 [Sorangium sp. So ce134]
MRCTFTAKREDVTVGCCAWAAFERFRGLPDPGVEPHEYDAIEYGWDGERAAADHWGLPRAW